MKRGERRRRGRRRRRRGFKVWITIGLYGFVWIAMVLSRFLNICMDLYGMDSWILDLVLCLGFYYEKF